MKERQRGSKYRNRERSDLKETKLWQQRWYWKAARSLDTLKPSMVSGLCLRAFKSLPQALGLKGWWETLSISFMPFVQPGHVTWIRVIGKKISIHAELCTGWFHQSDKLVILLVFCSLISSSLLSRCDYPQHPRSYYSEIRSNHKLSCCFYIISAFFFFGGGKHKFFMVVLMPILAETQVWRAAHYNDSSLRRLAQTWCFWS